MAEKSKSRGKTKEDNFLSILENLNDGYFETDVSGRFTLVNDSLCTIFGYSKKELIGMENRRYTDEENARKAFTAFNNIYKTGKTGSVFDYEIITKDGSKKQIEVSAFLIKDDSGKPEKNIVYRAIHKDGYIGIAEIAGFPLKNENGEPTGFRGIALDVSKRRRHEEKIQYMATHDALTDLPNRLMFSQLLNHAIQTAKRNDRKLAVLFIDLDRFKIINDSLGIAVNLSYRQLVDENLIEDIKTALKDSGLAPELLELEITESMVMHNPARMIAVLARIKSLGVRLAIDDFGTGYSSLAQIKNFPVDTLKVDRSFVRNLPEFSEDKAIAEAILSMGKSLGLRVVAEGVETEEQMVHLRGHCCDEMQGFFFSKPIAPENFAELLNKHISISFPADK